MTDPSIALQVRQPEVQSPLATIGALQNLKNAQVENALRSQQIEASRTQQRDVQAQADQRNRDLKDQNTLQEKYKDPAFALSVSSWDGKSPFPLDGLVAPSTAAAAKTKVIADQQQALTLTKDQRANNDAMHEKIGETLNGIAYDETGKKRSDAEIAALAPGAFAQLVADKQLKPENVPTVRGFDDINNYAVFNRHVQGLGLGASKLQESAGKPALQSAQTLEASGKGNEANAAAALSAFKLGLMKSATPENLAAQVDGIIDPVKYPAQNAQAKNLGALALKYGGPEAAQKAVQDVYSQIGAAQGEQLKIPVKVAEQNALLPGAVREAGAKANAEVGAHVATAVQTHQALAKLSPDAFAGIANPASQNAAMSEADKIYKEYTDKASSTQTLLDTIAAAQKGNKAAPGVIPIEQVRSVLSNGRVNAQELRAVSSQAGSLMDKIEGKIGSLTQGEPIPGDVLRDTAELAAITQKAARRNFDAGKDRLKMRGVDVTKLPEPNIGGASPTPPGVVKWGRDASGNPVPLSQ